MVRKLSLFILIFVEATHFPHPHPPARGPQAQLQRLPPARFVLRHRLVSSVADADVGEEAGDRPREPVCVCGKGYKILNVIKID